MSQTLRKIDLVASTDPSRTLGEGAAWAWATRHGAAEWASTEQLILWLGRGDLPPYTLVWRPGWLEWLPAVQFAELAAAFPRATLEGRSEARLELARPAPLAAPATPEQTSKHESGALLATLFVGALAVLSLGSSWAAFSLAMTTLQPVEPPSLQDPALSPAEGPASGAPPDAEHTADLIPLPSAHNRAVLRVGDLPKPRARALPPSPREPARPRVRSRH